MAASLPAKVVSCFGDRCMLRKKHLQGNRTETKGAAGQQPCHGLVRREMNEAASNVMHFGHYKFSFVLKHHSHEHTVWKQHTSGGTASR